MRIEFSPQRLDKMLVLSKAGDVLTINGEKVDLRKVNDNAVADPEKLSPLLVSAQRVNGDLVVRIVLPLGTVTTQDQLFPKAIIDPEDGDIPVPEAPPAEVQAALGQAPIIDPIALQAQLWGDLRAERARRLAGSDWTQLADAPVDKKAWAKYRQDLRDVPSWVQNPALVEWPVPPTA